MTLPRGIQSMTEGAGLHGAQFTWLFTVFLVVTCFFYLLVIAGLAVGLLRAQPFVSEARGHTALFSWMGLVLFGLTGLTLASYAADRASATAQPAFEIELTANQWWWDVNYNNGRPDETLRTANELHLPAGVPVRVVLKSNDVIHSFWVPAIAGKQDMIPGRTNDLVIRADRPGVYRGQCAEFCGMQHALMALDVTVEPRDAFRRWWQEQLQPASAPSSPEAKAGFAIVMNRQCAACHNIAGTPAAGKTGPDLTHFASRRTIAAGTLPMTRRHLQRWLADPQGVKPGNQMPKIPLDADQLDALTTYVGGLR